MRLLASIVLASGVFLSVPSWGAAVEAVKGSVLINQGNGFRTVSGAVQAKAGDAIMVRPGGNARVTYADGCPVSVNPGEVVTIAAESPCTAFAQQAPPGDPATDDTGVNPFLIGAGLLVAVGAGVGIYFATRSSGSTPAAAPASP